MLTIMSGDYYANSLAEILNTFFLDPKQGEQLGNNGFNAWKKRFRWEIIAKDYEKLYKEFVK